MEPQAWSKTGKKTRLGTECERKPDLLSITPPEGERGSKSRLGPEKGLKVQKRLVRREECDFLNERRRE